MISFVKNCFHRVVNGPPVKVGDKVYVECQYSEELPFKWNATSVHLAQPSLKNASVASTYGEPRGLLQTQRDLDTPYFSTTINEALDTSTSYPGFDYVNKAHSNLSSFYQRDVSQPTNQMQPLQYTSTPGKC